MMIERMIALEIVNRRREVESTRQKHQFLHLIPDGAYSIYGIYGYIGKFRIGTIDMGAVTSMNSHSENRFGYFPMCMKRDFYLERITRSKTPSLLPFFVIKLYFGDFHLATPPSFLDFLLDKLLILLQPFGVFPLHCFLIKIDDPLRCSLCGNLAFVQPDGTVAQF